MILSLPASPCLAVSAGKTTHKTSVAWPRWLAARPWRPAAAVPTAARVTVCDPPASFTVRYEYRRSNGSGPDDLGPTSSGTSVVDECWRVTGLAIGGTNARHGGPDRRRTGNVTRTVALATTAGTGAGCRRDAHVSVVDRAATTKREPDVRRGRRPHPASCQPQLNRRPTMVGLVRRSGGAGDLRLAPARTAYRARGRHGPTPVPAGSPTGPLPGLWPCSRRDPLLRSLPRRCSDGPAGAFTPRMGADKASDSEGRPASRSGHDQDWIPGPGHVEYFSRGRPAGLRGDLVTPL